MAYESMIVVEMKDFMRENRLRGYSKHRTRAELITFLENKFRPTPTPALEPVP